MDAASLEAMDAPRTFHYVFAHRTLPMMAARDAPALLAGLDRDGKSMLRLHWKVTCRTLGIEPQPSEAIGYGPGCDRMGVVALRYRGEQTIAGYRVGIVQLPLALQVREAHFVAIAHRDGQSRYLAWECTLSGGARIAEWTLTPQGPRGRRIGPVRDDASLACFVEELGRWLAAPPPPRVVSNAVKVLPQPTPAGPVVTWGDAALVGSLLLAWSLMIVVLTLL
ncbi:MAG: hypothetical protein AAF602_33085 [Myxococcota bacterium]